MPILPRLFAVTAMCLLSEPAAFAGGSVTGGASLAVSISGIKSPKGIIRLALCPPGAGFPECKGQAVRAADLAIADGKAHVVISGLAPGAYAVCVFHDANGNGKLDTFAGIPREGYGFSANPGFKPRAPRFEEAEIRVDSDTATEIRMRYIL